MYVANLQLRIDFRLMNRRLEDRIREQCAQLIGCENSDFQKIASELRASLNEHIERLRARLADYPGRSERRSASSLIEL